MRVSNPKINKEAVKTLVVLHGQREAARIAGLNENTVLAWCRRYGWKQVQPVAHPSQSICNQSPADAVATVLTTRKLESASHLSKYIVDASEKLANSNGDLKHARPARDIVAARSGVWPEERQGETGLTLNLLNLVMPAESARRSAHEDE